ncbi:MAG: sirtuin [Kangiellaceae bacterium]|nr:sirtuin [Kangiellaceae bacterium]
MDILYITGAGVSSESGIPTFRGEDGYWTIGSVNYTPQEMATRKMYRENPAQFLSWYYHRFATYRNHGPNDVHYWLADKNLITQNIDGLDGKAGNRNYIAVHGRLDQMTLFHHQGDEVDVISTPWDEIQASEDQLSLENDLKALFRIKNNPQKNVSYKPFVLLFDEYYTDLYRISESQQRMEKADKIVFMGTSFSVNITQMALQVAANRNIPIEIVDPNPVDVGYDLATYYPMRASEYILSC